MKLHANAALSLNKRRRLCERVVVEKWTLTKAAEAAEVSVRTARKWVRRYRAEGEAGLGDRPSTPRRQPTRTSEERVQAIAGNAVDAVVDGLGHLDPDRAGPAVAAGAAGAREPLRAAPPRRTHPRRRQEARAHPGRRRAPCHRPQAHPRRPRSQAPCRLG